MMNGNYGWSWMALTPLLWVALIGVVAWAIIRLTQPDRSAGAVTRPGESAREVLDRRFASGDIDGETYDRMRRKLTG